MKQESDELSVVRDGDLIRVIMPSHYKVEMGETINQQVQKLSGNEKLDVLIDFRNFKITDGGMEQSRDLIKDSPHNRIAIFGATVPSISRDTQDLKSMVGQPEKVKFFGKEEYARAWLEQE